MPVCVKLVITGGPLKGRTFRFLSRTFCTVGRDPDCLVSLKSDPPDTTLSRRHCLFDIDPPEALVFDLGSRNGTFVNGARFGGRDRTTGLVPKGVPMEVELHDGDTVRVGETCFRVAVEAGLSEADDLPVVLAELMEAEGAESGSELVGV